MPPPPLVASAPGTQLLPFHFKTCPDVGALLVVSTSFRKSILNVLILTVTISVSVAIAVAMLVPPAILSESLILAAVVDPWSAVIVSKTFCVKPLPLLLIVKVLPETDVVTFVPPSTVNVSLTILGAAEPVSALNVVKIFLATVFVTRFHAVPSHFQVVLPSVNVSATFGVFGKFIAIVYLLLYLCSCWCCTLKC